MNKLSLLKHLLIYNIKLANLPFTYFQQAYLSIIKNANIKLQLKTLRLIGTKPPFKSSDILPISDFKEMFNFYLMGILIKHPSFFGAMTLLSA